MRAPIVLAATVATLASPACSQTGDDTAAQQSGESALASIRITSPAANSTITGRTAFKVDTSGVPGVASVQYLINGRPMAGPNGPITTAPYSYDWHSALLHDGPVTLVAVARDVDGNVLTTSAPVPFRVINPTTPSYASKYRARLRGEAKVVSPTVTEGISGTMSWDVDFLREMTQADIDFHNWGYHNLVFWVDGERVASPLACTSPVTTPGWVPCRAHLDLDTTRYANGKHELVVEADVPVKAQMDGGQFQQAVLPVAVAQTSVTFANGRVLRDVRPPWREVFLGVGGRAQLALRALMTDGSEEPWTGNVTYESANPDVAPMVANGVVHGLATGATTITITAGNRKTSVRVFVGNTGIFPHFASDGRILNTYTPGASLWVRSVMGLAPYEISLAAMNPNLASEARAAGINVVDHFTYTHQPDVDLATWTSGYDQRWQAEAKIAKDNGFRVMLHGDDIARWAPNVNFAIGDTKDSQGVASGPARVRHALETAQASGIVIGIDMVDEVSLLWGHQPNPQTGGTVPSDAFVRLMSVMNGAAHRPKVTWPIWGGAYYYPSGPSAAHAWMGDPAFADYAMLHQTPTDAQTGYAHSYSLRQNVRAMESVHAYVDGPPLGLRRDAPMVGLVSGCGGWFLKPAAGDASEPTERETLLNRDTTELPSLSVMYAVAAGYAGTRAYHFDSSQWRSGRAQAKPSIGSYQNGASPPSVQYPDAATPLPPVGTDRWFSLAAAFNLVKQLEAYFLSPQTHAIHLGPSIVTGARQNPGGRTLLAINSAEAAATERVDLRSYRYPGAAIVRYRLTGGTLRTETIADREFDNVTFEPGETIVWLLRPTGSSDVVVPSVQISTPLPNSVITQDTVVKAAASDASGIARVEFFVDGSETPATTVTAAPYSFTWALSTARSGVWHAVTARAYDKAGNMSESRTMVYRP